MSNSGKSRKLALTLMLILLISAAAPKLILSSTFTVNTDREIYYPGDTVEIIGTSPEDAEVKLIVNGTETLLNVTLTAVLDGYYEYELELHENTTTGNYTIYATTGVNQVQAHIQVREIECNLYHNLEKVVDQTRKKLTEKIQELGEGEGSEELEEKLDEGDELLEEAYELMLDGNCQEAGQLMIRALNHYGETYREYEERDDDDKGLDDAHELSVKIKRAYQLLNRLNRTSQRLDEKGYDISPAQEELESVKTLLSQAENLLEDGKITDAEEKIESAEDKLDEIFDMLKEITRERRREQAKEFVKETKERLKQLEKSLKEILNNKTSEEDIEKVSEMFNNTIDQLEDVLGHLDDEDIESALDTLSETLEKNENDVDDLDIQRGELNRIKAIERQQHKIRNLKGKSEDITESELKDQISELLDEAESTLQEAIGNVTDEDTEDLIEEAESSIEEAEELLEEFEEDKESKEPDDNPGLNKDKKDHRNGKYDDPNIDKEDDEDDDNDVDDNDEDYEQSEDEKEDEEEMDEEEEEKEDQESDDSDDDADDEKEEDEADEIEIDSENVKNRGKGKKKGKNNRDKN